MYVLIICFARKLFLYKVYYKGSFTVLIHNALIVVLRHCDVSLQFYVFSRTGWSNFCTLVGHFSKLFEFAGLSRLKIPIFVPKSGCSLKKKKVFTWNRSPKFLFWRKIIAFSKKKLRLLLLIDKTCAKLICGMRPASP